MSDETETKPPTPETAPAPAEKPAKKRRGFAVMDPNKVAEIARRGGIKVHEKGTAHRFTSEQARAAGRKGGQAPHRARGRQTPSPQPSTPPPSAGPTSN